MARLRISKQARAELLEITIHIARDSLASARRFDSFLREKFRRLARTPGIGRSRDELSPGCRSFPVGRYIILYRHQRGIVEILNVIHGARDLGSIFGSESD
ncbi:MAG: type II toxin-antitoxin system RelE/ParE family toxin [Acidobacteria bacterium]|nr:type II toxin-antitoxin system RelE/ParE family toxin [Acidobacteriota bacterium]